MWNSALSISFLGVNGGVNSSGVVWPRGLGWSIDYQRIGIYSGRVKWFSSPCVYPGIVKDRKKDVSLCGRSPLSIGDVSTTVTGRQSA